MIRILRPHLTLAISVFPHTRRPGDHTRTHKPVQLRCCGISLALCVEIRREVLPIVHLGVHSWCTRVATACFYDSCDRLDFCFLLRSVEGAISNKTTGCLVCVCVAPVRTFLRLVCIHRPPGIRLVSSNCVYHAARTPTGRLHKRTMFLQLSRCTKLSRSRVSDWPLRPSKRLCNDWSLDRLRDCCLMCLSLFRSSPVSRSLNRIR